jgi:hypothetical protein
MPKRIIGQIVSFKPTMVTREILQDAPEEANSLTDWIEYLLTKGHEQYKNLKGEPVSQQEMGLCLRLGEQSDVTTEFSDWLKKKITILQDGRLEVDLRDLR